MPPPPANDDRPAAREFSARAALQRFHAWLDDLEPRTAFAALFVSSLFGYGLANSLKGFTYAFADGLGVGVLIGAALSVVGVGVGLALLYVTARLVVRLLRPRPQDRPALPASHKQRLRDLAGPDIRYPLK